MPYKDPAKQAESQRRRYWANPEQSRERGRKYTKLYGERHPEKLKEAALKRSPIEIKETQARWRERNKERKSAQVAKWKIDNPDKVRALYHKRRAQKTQAGGFFTSEEWFLLCFAVGFRCLCCGLKKPLEADHVVPISKGGTSWLWNIQPLCESCNTKKHCQIIDYRDSEQNSVGANAPEKEIKNLWSLPLPRQYIAQTLAKA